ncbi:class I SAM-dependent methyltransferase [Salinifilum aidingensis]
MDEIVRLCHLGGEVRLSDIPAADALTAAGLAAPSSTSGHYRGGEWVLTSYAGLMAVCDRGQSSGGGHVYLGEDGLRFVESIRMNRPTGRALDVGSGSGLTSAALAESCDSVTAVDVVEECVAASRITARLNGTESTVTVARRGLEELGDDVAFNCVAANLPGVPVPPSVSYPPEGDGGFDGLELMRVLLRKAAQLLDPDTGTLLMRFQSLGDDSGLLLLSDIREFAEATGYDVTVVSESAVPVEVRSALTARNAISHNSGMCADELIDVMDKHASGLGMPHYFASNLVARSGGTGKVSFVDLTGWQTKAVTGRIFPRENSPMLDEELIRARYYAKIQDLPDGFWENADEGTVTAPLARLGDVLKAVDECSDLLSVTNWIFPREMATEPARARFLLVPTAALLATLADLGHCELVATREGTTA